MWLILTEPYDETGPWLAQGLRPHTPFAVTHLTTRELTQGTRTSHGIDNGREWFRLHLANDVVVDSRALRGVVNRVCALPPGLAFRLQSPQRDHAERNFGLPLLHLLHGFPGAVLNRPTAQGISGDFRLDFEWAALAAQVGFTRAPARQFWPRSNIPAPSHWSREDRTADVVTVVVIGEQVLPLDASFSTMPVSVVASCRRLAALSRNTLLGLDLTRSPSNEWQFLRANLRPNLVPGGPLALQAVAHALASPIEAVLPLPGATALRTNANLPRITGATLP